ncbi:uncharacterized protein LOC112164076 [Rosa chinensis]|uniref:uncharacterized protein LOC112164076 n=1 Tax=Rosa chinensis TaxID=74649 RepID=UPI000D0935AA|nr:uncharacterized protein LOC112164076 [Rosa chinensis]
MKEVDPFEGKPVLPVEEVIESIQHSQGGEELAAVEIAKKSEEEEKISVLANRLKPLLDSFISPFQSAFVPGRLISDNSLVAFEVSHCLKRRRSGKKKYCSLKLDMSKAYDRVEWVFLEEVMRRMGFCEVWVSWVMDSVKTVSYSFIVNGEPRGRIIPSRRLRQGDAISPYLFLLCAEVLSKVIIHAESNDALHRVEICRGAPSVSHLFFADDSFIFCKAEVADVQTVKSILRGYELASGQQEELAALLGVTRVEKHDKYLGLPIEISYSKEEAFSFLIDRVRSRTQAKQGWRLVQKPNTLIAQLLKAKYFPTCSFMEAELKKGASYTWRSIIAGRAVLQKGMRIQVGDGATISLWDDPWVSVPYSFRPFSTVMEGTESWRVADVIDYEDKEWLTDVLGELFTRGEVDTIASIPLSIRGAADRWVWHFDAKGIYNVRSGYHVFLHSLKMEQTASSPASEQGGPLRKYWTKIWHANVPPKIKVLVWRLVHGIVPTSLEEFQKYHQKVACKKKRPLTKWQCPPRGRLKINIDGAFQVDSGVGGIGVVVRDDLGTGIAAIARPFLHAHSTINMEAEACRAGLLLGIHQGWSDVVIESDSALLIAALKSEEDNFSEHEVQVLCPPVAKY